MKILSLLILPFSLLPPLVQAHPGHAGLLSAHHSTADILACAALAVVFMLAALWLNRSRNPAREKSKSDT